MPHCVILTNLIVQVLDFFNSRMDMQELEGEWSVNKVLQVIINNCRSWRGEGMKVRYLLFLYFDKLAHIVLFLKA